MTQRSRAGLFAFIVTLGGFIFGLDAAVISGTVRFIAIDFGLNDLQIGTVVSAPGFGVLFALVVTGWVCERIGRKRALILVAVLYLVSAVCSALASSYWGLVAARFVGGLAFCSLSLASMYIGEISPPKLRGRMVAINQMNIVFGLSAAYFVNYVIVQSIDSQAEWIVGLNLGEHAWRYMLGSEIFPAFLWLVLLFWIPESPRWLVHHGRVNEAKATLAKIADPEEVETQLEAIQESLEREGNISVWTQFKRLLSPGMRRILWVGLLIAVVQGLSGINAILFYAPTIFEQLGIGTNAAFQQAIWIGLVSVVFTFLAILLVDRLGRRPMVIGGLVWLAASLGLCAYGFNQAQYELSLDSIETLPEALDRNELNLIAGKTYDSDIGFKKAVVEVLGPQQARDFSGALLQAAASLNGWLILGGILSFIAAFHFSIGPIMWVLFSEIFPTALRSVAIPSFAFVVSLSSWFIQKFFPWQLANMGSASVFLFYAVVAVFGLICLWRILPETKNLSLEEIEKRFRSAL
ncbi:MAG: MFS transporter [Verrucomicrobiota bacterium]